MERRLLLDVVVRERAAVLQQLTFVYQHLLIGGNALLVLDLRLHGFDRVRRLHVQRDGLALLDWMGWIGGWMGATRGETDYQSIHDAVHKPQTRPPARARTVSVLTKICMPLAECTRSSRSSSRSRPCFLDETGDRMAWLGLAWACPLVCVCARGLVLGWLFEDSIGLFPVR